MLGGWEAGTGNKADLLCISIGGGGGGMAIYHGDLVR